MENITFIDLEVGVSDNRIHDIGAVSSNGTFLHTAQSHELIDFLKDAKFIGGHNIIHHDLTYLSPILNKRTDLLPIDTLFLSPLLFPRRPYHALLKDDKLQTDELNNPINDCKKAMALFDDEVTAFEQLPGQMQEIFYYLLRNAIEFKGFFEFIHYTPSNFANKGIFGLFRKKDFGIREFFNGRICSNADLESIISQNPVELAYALALIHAGDSLSIIPPWTLKRYPKIYNIIVQLKNKPCAEGCPYCKEKLNVVAALKKYFGYDNYRTYNGEPLQEKAVQSAVNGKSLLVVFPTGGGKSITFQVPAFMAGDNAHGLTVVISPLQSLMKDQVDNLIAHGITGAVTINGLLSPVERSSAFQQIADGSASLLYISPEMLRSRTIEKLLLSRNVVRFVIDEAHCFSAWGQDFRIDYLYIGDFINKLQKKKQNGETIQVSCFTATAKQKVIRDICDYFRDKLNLELEIYASNATRENLSFNVLFEETEEDKYIELRNLIEWKNCPTIVYVSRTKRTLELAQKLTSDGFPAKPFNGKMLSKDKIENQDDFISGKIKIIVATSAFGMGVDKSDVGLVVHYDISDSLENYIQESGRAGRDRNLHADCYVLYNDADLDKHFILLNQTKLSLSDIQQVWQAIKRMTGSRKRICCSPLEIARMAGWDNTVSEIETRVKTAVASLENAGYIRRGNNVPHIYATGILAKNVEEAIQKIGTSRLLTDDSMKDKAKRIIKALISSRSIAQAGNDDAESRIDYLADILGLTKSEVVNIVNNLRQEGLLADSLDMSAYIQKDDTLRRTSMTLERYAKLENFILSLLEENTVCEFNLKELNALADEKGIFASNVKNIRTILYYLCIKHYIRKEEHKGTANIKIMMQMSHDAIMDKFNKRINICRFIVEEFYRRSREQQNVQSDSSRSSSEETLVNFSPVELYKKYCTQYIEDGTTQDDVQDALLYLSSIGAVRLEGGFLVLYNGMEITRLVMDNRIRYKQEDYASLNDFYTQKIQQIHIVGAFANMMVKNYKEALQFVNDYFQLDYRKFISKYFRADQIANLSRNMTNQRFNRLFGCLSAQQKAIIDDNTSKHIVVVAGPGSGKTRVLVHKLAAMLTLEDVKHEQLLMVTFSRAAATEFKMRLKDLIGNAANFVEIKTFHSYCFDLMGKIGSLEESCNVVKSAVKMIREGEVEPERISKSVLVIDEAQDMDQDEFELVRALMDVNDDMRVIAVGDDDQNIFEFRGSDSKYMRALVNNYDARMYELVENFRSKKKIVEFSNAFARLIHNRMKNKEIVANNKEEGTVTITRHEGPEMEIPMIEQLIANHDQGSTCIMASTNDEAFRILGILLKRGIHAKLIQSNEGFSLYNLAEVRYFLKKVSGTPAESGNRQLSPVIPSELWIEAKEKLERDYKDSTCLENCLNMLNIFESTYTKKYRSDLKDFIRESKYEDFYKEEAETIYVSTIHKTKGREFDHVYLMLNQVQMTQDADLRKLYVGMTRARTSMHIHYFQIPELDRMVLPDITRIADSRKYPEADEIALQLTHKDVYLSFFKDKKGEILKMRSGYPLEFFHEYLNASLNGKSSTVVRLSKSCIEQLFHLTQKGYVPVEADVRFIVAWKGEEDTQESAVILPSLYLRKHSPENS